VVIPFYGFIIIPDFTRDFYALFLKPAFAKASAGKAFPEP
jgi:hypothetical protein